MLPPDLALIACLSLLTLAWWWPVGPRQSRVLCASAGLALLAAVAGLYLQRWQAAPGALTSLCALLLFAWRRRQWRAGRRAWPSGLLVAAAGVGSAALLWAFPLGGLPAPSGPYAVGVRNFELDDASRPGLLGAPANAPRRLLVRVWYPASPAAGATPRAYFDAEEGASTARGFGALFHFPPLLSHLVNLRTHAYDGAPLRADLGTLPVLFFSHGYGGYAGANSVLMEELASHGYAVYAVQHTGDSLPTLFPDHSLAPTDPGLLEHLRAAADSLPATLRQGYIETDLDRRLDGQLNSANAQPTPANRAISVSAPVWLADRLFVHDRLQAGQVPASVADLVAHSDFTRTGEMGMSFGGSVSGAVCQVDRRCAAAVNLDGGDFHYRSFDTDLPVPLLMLHTDLGLFYRMLRQTPPAQPRTFNDFSYETFAHAGQRADIYRLVLRDSMHPGLTDMPLFIRPALRGPVFGGAPSEVLLQAPNALVLGFFDHYLRGQDNGFPQAQMQRFPGWLSRYDNSDVRRWWLAKPEAERAALELRIQALRDARPMPPGLGSMAR